MTQGVGVLTPVLSSRGEGEAERHTVCWMGWRSAVEGMVSEQVAARGGDAT